MHQTQRLPEYSQGLFCLTHIRAFISARLLEIFAYLPLVAVS